MKKLIIICITLISLSGCYVQKSRVIHQPSGVVVKLRAQSIDIRETSVSVVVGNDIYLIESPMINKVTLE